MIDCSSSQIHESVGVLEVFTFCNHSLEILFSSMIWCGREFWWHQVHVNNKYIFGLIFHEKMDSKSIARKSKFHRCWHFSPRKTSTPNIALILNNTRWRKVAVEHPVFRHIHAFHMIGAPLASMLLHFSYPHITYFKFSRGKVNSHITQHVSVQCVFFKKNDSSNF